MNTDKLPWILAKNYYPSEITSFLDELFEIQEIRGKIDTCNGILFKINTNEKNHPDIPHVHAKYGEYEISISILDGKVLAGNLPNNKQKFAKEWILSKQEFLLGEWYNIAITASTTYTVSRFDDIEYNSGD